MQSIDRNNFKEIIKDVLPQIKDLALTNFEEIIKENYPTKKEKVLLSLLYLFTRINEMDKTVRENASDDYVCNTMSIAANNLTEEVYLYVKKNISYKAAQKYFTKPRSIGIAVIDNNYDDFNQRYTMKLAPRIANLSEDIQTNRIEIENYYIGLCKIHSLELWKLLKTFFIKMYEKPMFFLILCGFIALIIFGIDKVIELLKTVVKLTN